MNKKWILQGFLGLVIATAIIFLGFNFTKQRSLGPTTPTAVDWQSLGQHHGATIPNETDKEPPAQLNLSMPFFSQAPYGNWDYPWQEACEEASLLLVVNSYQNLHLTSKSFNEELLNIVAYENETFGDYKDSTLEEVSQILKERYNLDSVIHDDPSFADIQKILAKGHFIVAPFAGKLLKNPHFKNGGPLYHMLVIKGYDSANQSIITHDVGTRSGADYTYSWTVLQNAMHDWDDTDILNGKARILEVLP